MEIHLYSPYMVWTGTTLQPFISMSITVQQDATIYSLLYFCKLLYVFRVVTPPIVRSTYNCNYSIGHWSNRLCYLPLWWRSWNFQLFTAGPRGQFPRWRRSRKRLSACSVLRCPDLWLQCSVSFVHCNHSFGHLKTGHTESLSLLRRHIGNWPRGPAVSMRSELLVAHEKLGQLPLLTVYVVSV